MDDGRKSLSLRIKLKKIGPDPEHRPLIGNAKNRERSQRRIRRGLQAQPRSRTVLVDMRPTGEKRQFPAPLWASFPSALSLSRLHGGILRRWVAVFSAGQFRDMRACVLRLLLPSVAGSCWPTSLESVALRSVFLPFAQAYRVYFGL